MVETTIVGAGPAGLISAEVLAKHGMEVNVIDKDVAPGERKPCGGMLRIDAANLFHIPWKLANRKIKGIRVILPDHLTEEVDYSRVISLNIDRGTLGEYLIDRVKKLGVSVNTGTKVVDVTQPHSNGSGSYELTCLSAGGRTQRVGAGFLVAADGTSSIVVKKTRTHRAFKPDQLGQCVQYQMQLDNDIIDRRIGDRNEMYYGHDVSPFGYAWIFPKDNQVTVGVGSLLSAVKVNLRNYLDYLVRKHPVASRKLSDAKILKFETALCPLSGVISPTYGNNLIVVGDAAGHCSPISGEGIYYSMVAGGIAGEVASQGIKDGDLSVGYLKRYEHQWRAKFGSDLRWGKWFEGIANRGGFMSRTFKKDTPVKDSLSRKITDILGGIRPYRDTLVRALPEFLIGKIFQMIGGN